MCIHLSIYQISDLTGRDRRTVAKICITPPVSVARSMKSDRRKDRRGVDLISDVLPFDVIKKKGGRA